MAQRPAPVIQPNDWETIDDWETIPDTTVAPSTPVDDFVTEPEPSSNFQRIWGALSQPLIDAPSRFARSMGEYIDQPVNRDDTALSHALAMGKGFTRGALEGVGDVASGFTSPINLGTMALTGGSSTALRAGLPRIAQAMTLGARGAGALTAAHGMGETFGSDSTLGERGMGLAEIAGGIAGMRHTPSAAPRQPVGKTWESFWAPTSKGAKPGPAAPTGAPAGVQAAATEIAPGIVDTYAAQRNAPIGTKYTIAPIDMPHRKAVITRALGYDMQLNDKGRWEVTKVRESPPVNYKPTPKESASILAEVTNLPRTLMASEDMSAPLRQGIGLMHKGAFWKALPDMVKAWGSEDFYKKGMSAITDDPIFKKTVDVRGKVQPSFAEKAGLKLTDLDNMTRREESMMSSLADKIPGVRRSNRAYTLFLNKVRSDVFKQMTADFGSYSGINVKNNLPMAKQIAEFVSNASGRGNLGVLEPSAKALSSLLFSPRLLASRLQMMAKGGRAVFDPQVYMSSAPNIRREYLKSLATIAAVSGSFGQMMRMAGATIEPDVASSDFGKVKFGDTRIDPYAGFQQPIVLMQRMMPHVDLSSQGMGEIGGRMKSTTTGEEYNLTDPGYGESSQMDTLMRFLRSKTNPIINFAWGLYDSQKELSGKPMQFGINAEQNGLENVFENSIAQRFIPMIFQDIYDLAKSENTPPEAKALSAFLSSLGMGSQTYEGN